MTILVDKKQIKILRNNNYFIILNYGKITLNTQSITNQLARI